MDELIVRVRCTSQGQKLITIPKNSDIEEGDYVQIRKVILR